MKGKNALVTGASRGLGAEIALALAGAGAHVVGAARDEQALEAVAKRATNGMTSVAVDLTSEAGIAVLQARLRDAPPDVVVHAIGGTLGLGDPAGPLSMWRQVMALNLDAVIAVNELVLPSMRERGWGRVVHLSSVAGGETAGPAPYVTAKAALNAYTRSAGRALLPGGVVMFAVAPGLVASSDGHWERKATRDPAAVDDAAARSPAGRMSSGAAVADAVLKLLSEPTGLYAGGVIPLDGGVATAL